MKDLQKQKSDLLKGNTKRDNASEIETIDSKIVKTLADEQRKNMERELRRL